MNPLKLSCHHGFFKSRIAFGSGVGRVITFCTFMPLVESSMISWLRRAASKRSCVTSIHAMPCRSIFSTSMATKISRKSRSKPTNGSSSKARSQPHSSRRKNATRFAMPPDNSVGYLFKSPAVSPTFAASAMISPSSGCP